MFFLLFGSSGSGKTAALDQLRGCVHAVEIHDFDEIGVPAGADVAWRHRANERWVRRALEYQAEGTDFVLAGQAPFGELLATPSAFRLEAISGCLLECDDATRVARLRARGPEWLSLTGGTLQDYLNWAARMREHVAGDPRWRVRVIDTSASPVEEVAEELVAWIEQERALFRSGAHPLAGSRLANHVPPTVS